MNNSPDESKLHGELNLYLKENIIQLRSYVTNISVISAAVASFSMPLFLVPSINHLCLFFGVTILLFGIILGSGMLKEKLESENNELMLMQEVILKRDIKKGADLLEQIEKRRRKKDFFLDCVYYPLLIGIIFVLISIFFILIPCPKT